MDKLLGDSVRLIEGESFYFVESGGIHDGCNVKCESDGGGQQAGIDRSRV